MTQPRRREFRSGNRRRFIAKSSILPGYNGIDPEAIRCSNGGQIREGRVAEILSKVRTPFIAAQKSAKKRRDPIDQIAILQRTTDWFWHLTVGHNWNRGESFHTGFNDQ